MYALKEKTKKKKTQADKNKTRHREQEKEKGGDCVNECSFCRQKQAVRTDRCMSYVNNGHETKTKHMSVRTQGKGEDSQINKKRKPQEKRESPTGKIKKETRQRSSQGRLVRGPQQRQRGTIIKAPMYNTSIIWVSLTSLAGGRRQKNGGLAP